jgi:hypothetical protein
MKKHSQIKWYSGKGLLPPPAPPLLLLLACPLLAGWGLAAEVLAAEWDRTRSRQAASASGLAATLVSSL